MYRVPPRTGKAQGIGPYPKTIGVSIVSIDVYDRGLLFRPIFRVEDLGLQGVDWTLMQFRPLDAFTDLILALGCSSLYEQSLVGILLGIA